MKFGVSLGYGIDDGVGYPTYTIDGARIAEDLDYESVWIGEHVVIPRYDSPYPYSADQRLPIPDRTAIPDPLTWLAFVAGFTHRIRLATGIMVLPQRQPILLAKETATLDKLSRGRLMLGVGIGWLREESEALGVPFPRRGARMDEHITTLRALWTQHAPTIDGEFTHVEEARSYPKPEQPAGPPIIIGGSTPAAAQRAGRLGDGFYPVVPSAADLPPLIEIMRRTAEEHGRDPDQIEVSAASFALADDTVYTPQARDEVLRYRDAGAHRFVLFRTQDTDLDTLTRALEHFATKIAATINS